MMGMGTLEVLVILLVAFVFLGPKKMIDGAKFLGKLFLQVRQIVDEIPKIDLSEDKIVEENEAKYSCDREGIDNSSATCDSIRQTEVFSEGPVSFKAEKSYKNSEKSTKILDFTVENTVKNTVVKIYQKIHLKKWRLFLKNSRNSMK